MSEQYDVIVIGGGVAGLSTAANITEGNVLLLEKDRIRTEEKRFLRFTFLNSMDRFGLSDSIITKYNVLSFRSTTGSKFDFNFDDFEILLLDLGKIHSSLKKHIDEKQEIREKIEIIDVKQNNHGVEVEISKDNNIETVSAKYLVDASGNGFLTRKKFNLKCPDLLCTCLGATFKDGYIGEKNVITFIVPTDNFKCGGWIYPFNSDHYAFGIADALRNIVSPETVLNEQFNKTQKHPIFEDMIQGGFRQNWDTGILPMGISYPLVFDRICYVGDVVGQATPWNGDGVRPILETSIICGNAINLALKRNDKSSLENYQNDWDFTYGSVYNNYDHWKKWTKTTEAWEKTSIKNMLNDSKYGQKHLFELLKYYYMSKRGRDYLKNLKSQFYQ